MANIFTMIKTMVNHNINEEYSNDGMFLTGIKMKSIKVSKYPQGAIKWLLKNKICTLDNVKIEGKGENKTYKITFKDFNLEHSFFKREYRRTLLASQMLDYNNKNRVEEQQTYSQSRVDNEYYYQDKTRYEYLDKADSCMFDMFLQSIGITYHQYQLMVENREISSEEYDIMFRTYLNECSQEEYAY